MTILQQAYKREKQFSRWQKARPEVTFSMIVFGLFPQTIFKVRIKTCFEFLFKMLVKKRFQW